MKKNLRLLFIRPPRHYWPILNEADNFLLPLAYPTLAGYIREKLPEIEIEIIDCCAHKIGWQSFKKLIIDTKPDIVAIGEKVCYSNESNKAFKIIKEINKKIITLAGGQFYSHVIDSSFSKDSSIDFIMRFEGEISIVEFLKNILNSSNDFSNVPNLAYRKSDAIIKTKIAPLIDMNNIPIPAYDLSHLEKYKPFGKLWPKSITIQRSRGCTNNCNYCSWIAQESQLDKSINDKSPIFRTKSVEQMINEIEILYCKYGIRYLFWVDASWNYGDNWMNEFCDEIIKRKYNLGWWAFIRLDLISSQFKNGTLKKMVKAGLRHILSGADRPGEDELNSLNKRTQNYDIIKESLKIFKNNFPEVFRQCTFITGLPNDNADSIKNLLKYAHDIDVDFAAFHTLTPFPGTPLYDEALKSGLLIEKDFSNYDMFFPVMKTNYLSQEEVAYWTNWCQSNFVIKKPFRYFSRFFSKYPIRRKLHWWFAYSISKVMIKQIYDHIKGVKKFEGFSGVNKLWKPDWYEN